MNARRAVAIVRHSFYPFELNVKREAEALRDAGFDVHVICLRGPGEAARETIEGVEVYRLPVTHRRGKILRYLWEYNAFFALASWKLARLHRKHRFAAVQVNTMPDYLVFAAWYPKRAGARVVLHLHEPVPELFRTMFPKRWYTPFFVWTVTRVEQAAIRFADRVLTVTDQMRDNYVRRGADASKFTVVVNVPDDRLFRRERYADLRPRIDAIKAEERARGVFRVLTHGAIEERYGFDTVVRAIARARERVPGIQFRFMGAGEYLDEVKELARDLGVSDRVHHLGFVPFEQMVEEILLADVCVVTVKRNAYSVLVHTNKMYEYMALGRPVIASRLDSVAAYFPSDALSFFEPSDAAGLGEALGWAATHPQELAQHVAAADARYGALRWEKEKHRYLAAYNLPQD
ncbi:MAG TPA: glycosyltransferase family 4 protein [Candidatus Krumholzibacteria bacterium]|nr:glycosyltransferase family 4 protein [Candidatus Krumholzibacteria bacterium]